MKFVSPARFIRKSIAKRGFMLLETLFAIFLVLTAALIVAATMPVSGVSRQKAMNEDRAMDLAQKQMEAIRALGFQNANPSQLAANGLIDSTNSVGNNLYTFTNTDSANLDNPSLLLPSGAGTIEIDQLNLNMIQLIITVTWTDRGTPEKYSIGTLEADL